MRVFGNSPLLKEADGGFCEDGERPDRYSWFPQLETVERHSQAVYCGISVPVPVPFTFQMIPWLAAGAFAVALIWAIVWAQRRYRRLADAFRDQRRSVAGVSQMLNRIRHAIESASDAIGIGDMQGMSLYHNRAHVALFGYTVEELNAIDENMVLFADRTVAAAIHASIRAGYSWVGETEVRTKDGRSVPCLVRADIIRDDEGRPAGIFGVFTDVTERRRLQELLDRKAEEAARVNRLESMGMLAGGIAHDFGNLIMAMVGSIELMKMEPDLPNPARDRLASLEKTVWRANDVTKQLVDFAKGSEPRMGPVALELPLKESANYAVMGSSVELGFSIAANLRKVRGDEGQLVQVFNNISVNAVQAMPSGGRLTVAAENKSTGPNGEVSSTGEEWVHVSISDTGTGIAPENLGKVFDPFFTTKDKGTGFGLATCYTIIKKHHGQLSVESEPGCGTTFHIMLPAHPSLV
jgi:PAS domain S-box-containing protein